MAGVAENNTQTVETDTLTFSVDAALLRELGERLIGQPHIALAELVKNSYDADANNVAIRFFPDRIEVVDDGHGMTPDEFRNYWMRVGSPHKEQQRLSRHYKRPLTGSKGVGRLAVQFLAREMELCTVAKENPSIELRANINWDDAVQADELTEAKVQTRKISPPSITFPRRNPHGTKVSLTKLNQEWTTNAIVELAQELWWLAPPFRSRIPQHAFNIEFESPDDEAVEKFKAQMGAVLNIWEARLIGKLTEKTRVLKDEKGKERIDRLAHLSLELSDGDQYREEYWIPDCKLQDADFEIRIFELRHRL